MKEQAHERQRTSEPSETVRRLRPVDGFVVGGDNRWQNGRSLWQFLSQPGERLIDFFLEDEGSSVDPLPCACSRVLEDGTVLIGEIDWEMDRFLSEMLDEQEAATHLD